MKYDVQKIKTEIKLMARALREHNLAFKQAQREKRNPFGLPPSDELTKQLEAAFVPHDLRLFRSNYSGAYLWGAVSLYFTRLCALRASMRGRLHFSPNTRPATLEDLGLEGVDLDSQREWAECIADRYEMAEERQPEQHAAG
jgi:hypothetical protein